MDSNKQRYYDKLASYLLLSGLMLGLITAGLTQEGYISSILTMTAASKAALFLIISLKLIHYYYIGKSKMWAKVILVLLVASTSLTLLFYTQGRVTDSSAREVIDYMIDLSQVIAAFLVFRYKFMKASNEQKETLTS